MSRSKQPVSRRQLAWSVVLAVTVAATLWAAQLEDEDGGVAPLQATTRPARSAAAAAKSTAAPSPAATNWAQVERAPWPTPPPAQLAAWSPPAAPPVPRALAPTPVVEAVPTAPPFPYQLIGRLEQGGISQALLFGGSRSLNAKAGDVIDGQWRVEQVGPSGLSLIWLPGQQPQTIQFRPS